MCEPLFRLGQKMKPGGIKGCHVALWRRFMSPIISEAGRKKVMFRILKCSLIKKVVWQSPVLRLQWPHSGVLWEILALRKTFLYKFLSFTRNSEKKVLGFNWFLLGKNILNEMWHCIYRVIYEFFFLYYRYLAFKLFKDSQIDF